MFDEGFKYTEEALNELKSLREEAYENKRTYRLWLKARLKGDKTVDHPENWIDRKASTLEERM